MHYNKSLRVYGNNSKKQIDYRFCFLYVVGSFSVICGHLGQGINLFYDWFPPFSFHLPLFLFSSGYFYDRAKSDNIGKYVIHKAKTLLVPLYLWNCFYAIVIILTHRLGFTIGENVNLRNLLWGPFYNGHQFAFNCPSWFVAPLFLVQIFNALFRKIIRKIGLIENEWFIILIYFLLAYFSCDYLRNSFLGEINLPLAHMFTMLPYYEAGILYKEKIENKISVGHFFCFVFIFFAELLITHITGRVLAYNIVLFTIERYSTGFHLLSYVQTFLGIAFWVKISNILLPVIQEKKYIKTISDSAFSIMVNPLSAAMLLKCFFAMVYKYTSFCGDFSMDRFLSEVYYVYLPRGNEHWHFVYDFIALLVPVWLQQIINKAKRSLPVRRLFQ